MRKIDRHAKLSQNTIRKYLQDGQREPKYPQRKSPSKLDPYAEVLASWLAPVDGAIALITLPLAAKKR